MFSLCGLYVLCVSYLQFIYSFVFVTSEKMRIALSVAGLSLPPPSPNIPSHQFP